MVNPKNLFDIQFISDYFPKKITNPNFQNIDWSKISITPIKKNIGPKDGRLYYHFVIRYDVKNINQPIFCSAHWEEARQNAYRALKFIDSQIPSKKVKPLFFDKKYNAFFYLGVNGENLQYYIKNQPEKIENILKLSAIWLTKLHQIKIDCGKHNFNPENSKIETIIPGSNYYFKSIQKKAPTFLDDVRKIYNRINKFDEKNLKQNKHYLIHGDFHPENIIVDQNDPSKIAVVDYTDVCIADFARDLANLNHQLYYMINRFAPKLSSQIPNFQNTFLNTYLNKINKKLTPNLQERINYYKSWAALRNAIFFLIKDSQEPDEAEKSINDTYEYLNLTK